MAGHTASSASASASQVPLDLAPPLPVDNMVVAGGAAGLAAGTGSAALAHSRDGEPQAVQGYSLDEGMPVGDENVKTLESGVPSSPLLKGPIAAPINLPEWLKSNSHLLKPPVGESRMILLPSILLAAVGREVN